MNKFANKATYTVNKVDAFKKSVQRKGSEKFRYNSMFSIRHAKTPNTIFHHHIEI